MEMRKRTVLASVCLLFISGCTINGVPIISLGFTPPVVAVSPVQVGVAPVPVYAAPVAVAPGAPVAEVEEPEPVPEPVPVVQYDDPVRGWYIAGYWSPFHVWIAPCWTTDVFFLHDHFGYYHGGHRGFFERDYFHRDRFRRGLDAHHRHQERSRHGQRGKSGVRGQGAHGKQSAQRSSQRSSPRQGGQKNH